MDCVLGSESKALCLYYRDLKMADVEHLCWTVSQPVSQDVSADTTPSIQGSEPVERNCLTLCYSKCGPWLHLETY